MLYTAHYYLIASKMWSLGRLLPMIIGTEITDEDDPNWLHYLQLLSITEYVFAPVVHPMTPSHLQVINEHHHHHHYYNDNYYRILQILIEENLETFGILYKQASFIPKMHYLIHIPQYLQRYIIMFKLNSLLLYHNVHS